MVKRTISIISTLILVTSASLLLPMSAQAVPQPPHRFYGGVTIGGTAAPDGVTVTAVIAGASFPYTPSAQTSGGRYGEATPLFKVPADDPDTGSKEGGVNGDTVYFYVQGVAAGSYTYEIGGSTEVSLAITALPTLPKPTNVQRTTPDTDNTPTFTWNAVTGAKAYEVRIDTASFSNIGNVTTHTLATIADGSHIFEVRAVDSTDQAGASSDLYPFTIDTTPPGVAITALSPDPTSDNTPTLSGTATDTATSIALVEYRVDGGSWTAATATDGAFDETSEDYYVTTSVLADGSHTIEVRASDTTGHVTASVNYASDTFTIDTVPPIVTLTPLSPDRTSDSTPTLSGTATDNTTTVALVEYRVDGGSWTAATATDGAFDEASEDYTLTTSRLTSGSHTIEVRATDAAGNVTTAANYDSDTFTVTTAAAGGGGGGGGAGGGAPQPSVTYVYDYVTEEGEFTSTVIAKSADGKVGLTINEGVVGKTKYGRGLTSITITEVAEPPAPPADCSIIGLTYDIGPDGVTFETPIAITFTYDPDEIPEGVNEENLLIAMWDAEAGEWITLEGCTVDPLTHTITAPLSHFTNFTVLAYTRPAVFTASDLTIFPIEVDTGESVTTSVRITNTGDLTGSYEVTLKIDNAVVATEDVTLAGGTSQTVTFTVTQDAAGTYTANVDGLSGTFIVKTPPAPPAPATFATSDLTISPTEVDIGASITISVLVTNTGDLTGSYEVTLKIDNAVVATEDVTLAGGASQTVAFTTAKDVAGTYTVNVDGLSGTFIVKTAAVPAPEPMSWGLIGGIIAAAIVIGVVILLVIRRRTA